MADQKVADARRTAKAVCGSPSSPAQVQRVKGIESLGVVPLALLVRFEGAGEAIEPVKVGDLGIGVDAKIGLEMGHFACIENEVHPFNALGNMAYVRFAHANRIDLDQILSHVSLP